MTIINSVKLDSFREVTGTIFETCVGCNLCKKECGFLQKYGTPGEIAGLYNSHKFMNEAFECSLCSLCTSVCPIDLDPSSMFLAMRRRSVSEGTGFYSKHSSIVKYEKKGTSRKYSLYLFPENCDTVFFPGCALTGTRPAQTLKTLNYLKSKIPFLGVVLDCCTKPSHDLGRHDYFHSMFTQLVETLKTHGIKNIIVACPNCYEVFKSYGSGLKTISLYEVMAENGFLLEETYHAQFMIHDPCVTRFESSIQNSVRSLARNNGLKIKEPEQSGSKTLCCGEGGSVGCLNPEFSSGWTTKRTAEAGDIPILSYCAGCVNFLSKKKTGVPYSRFSFRP